MELKDLLRQYRKSNKLSVRKFAEILDVNKYRLEKWETGSHPNYQDTVKIKRFFGLQDVDEISEDFLNGFKAKSVEEEKDELLRLKDQIIEEKEKRIQALEETIHILKETQGLYKGKKG